MDSDGMVMLAAVFLLISIVLTIFGLFWYSGLFCEITVKTCKPPFKNLEVAYKFSTGPYKGCSYLFTEVHALAESQKNIGMYYDDPSKVENEKLRYMVGAVLSDGINKDLDASEEIRAKLVQHGYKIQEFPDVDNAVMTTFPFTSMVSIMIGISRVYPKLREYIEEHRLCAYPAIELYGSDDILFCMPLSKQDEFFVTEALPEEDMEYSDNENESSTHTSNGSPAKIESTSQHKDSCREAAESSDNGSEKHQKEQGPSRSSSAASSFEEIGNDMSE